MIIPMFSGKISPDAQKRAATISSIMSSYLRMDGWINCPKFYIRIRDTWCKSGKRAEADVTNIIYFSLHLRMHTTSFELRKNFSNVPVNTDRLLFDFSRTYRLSLIDAGIGRVGVLCGHLPKRIFDDDRGVMFIAHLFYRLLFAAKDKNIPVIILPIYTCCFLPAHPVKADRF